MVVVAVLVVSGVFVGCCGVLCGVGCGGWSVGGGWCGRGLGGVGGTLLVVGVIE